MSVWEAFAKPCLYTPGARLAAAWIVLNSLASQPFVVYGSCG